MALEELEVLELQGTRITDAGLQHLAGVPSLKKLLLGRTKVSAQGVAELRRALPNCEISADAPPESDGDAPE